MRALIQRVKEGSVSIGGTVHARMGQGLLIFLGIARTDTTDDARYLAGRCANLRIFEDRQGKMNLSVQEIEGKTLVISQFTLYADTRRGNRPGFSDAAPPESAEGMYDEFVKHLRAAVGDANVGTGVFRAMMDVSFINDGPVTIMIESKEHDS